MTTVTVRHVPDATRDELAARAARAGQSLQEYLLAALIEMAARPDLALVLEQVRQRKATLSTKVEAADIIAHRDVDRR